MHSNVRRPESSRCRPVRRSRAAIVPPLWASLLALGFVQAAAAQDTPRFALRAHWLWLSPAGDTSPVATAVPGEAATYSVTEDGSGFELGLEYRVGPRLGVELGVVIADLDASLRVGGAAATVEDVETQGIESVSLGVAWHLFPERRFDLALGVFAAQTTFDDVIFLTEAGRAEKHTFDDDHGFGVEAAVEVPLQRDGRFTFRAELRYLVTILESEVAGQDLDLDPVVLALGIGYRF
jgi:outer membrane protein W